jgi:CPA2 family monovalent cation:H+ antiporter-2
MPVPESEYLIDVVIILLAAVIFVSIFQRLKLSPLLGYLVAGAVIGPFGLSLVDDVEETRALAELGIVFLLFMVGLELPPERIRLVRWTGFALGGAQIACTGLFVAALAAAAGRGINEAIVVGGALALSSTAVVVQLLSDRDEFRTRFGRSAFAILLVQDLAVAPLLVLVLALGQVKQSLFGALGIGVLGAVAAFIAIFVIGRLVLRPLFRPIAATRNPEVFAALTLFIVLFTGLLTQMAGLSMAFGAFLAGMLLAETAYRHQVAAVIHPFRGLLLGLFFITVGMSIDLGLVLGQAGPIALILVVLLLGKGILLAVLCRLFGMSAPQALRIGAWLCQGGEFAFILFRLAMDKGVVTRGTGELLIVVVALSMMLTPFIAEASLRIARRWEGARIEKVSHLVEDGKELADHVVIAGFGRVGEAVAAQLGTEGVSFVAVDLDPRHIHRAQERKLPVYYGDGSRPEVLEALGIMRARAMVVALDDSRATMHTVALVRYIFPDLTILARARDAEHAEDLRKAGATQVVLELVETGRILAGSILAGRDKAQTGDE